MSLDNEIFKKKTFSNLLEEIYENQKKREKQIMGLIGELRPLVEDMGSATMVVPLIKEYMDLGLKNDDALLKMATIVQRIFANQNASGGDFTISDEERKQLLGEIDKIAKSK
jgi:hypothetical protein